MNLPTTGAYTVEVVGESHRQDALRSIAGLPTQQGHYKRVTATLQAEPSNPADPNAVMVLIDRHHVGYLDRDSARVYHTWLAKHATAAAVATCPAVITGGFKRGAEVGQYGVVLDLGVHGVKRRAFAPHAPTKAQRVGRNRPGMSRLVVVVLVVLGIVVLAAIVGALGR